MWVHASRIAQGLEDKVADREVIAKVVALLAPASRLRPSIHQIATVYTWPRSAPDIPSRGQITSRMIASLVSIPSAPHASRIGCFGNAPTGFSLSNPF